MADGELGDHLDQVQVVAEKLRLPFTTEKPKDEDIARIKTGMHQALNEMMSIIVKTNEQRAQRAITILKSKLEQCGLDPDYPRDEMLARKEMLSKTAEHLSQIADRLLKKFRELTLEQGLDAGTITFFVVGGRVRATPIKDNTDFDIVLTAENRLNPRGDKTTITYKQRHAIWDSLNKEIEPIFHELGLKYEKGVIELKAMGEDTAVTHEAKHPETENASLKIWELTET